MRELFTSWCRSTVPGFVGAVGFAGGGGGCFSRSFFCLIGIFDRGPVLIGLA